MYTILYRKLMEIVQWRMICVKNFHTPEKSIGSVMTIVGCDVVIVGSGQAIITLPMGTSW